MYEFKLTSGICIPKECGSQSFYSSIKEHLVRRMKDYQTSIYSFYIFYIEGEKILKIPRFFPIEQYVSCNIIDNISDGQDIPINHNIQLRDDLQKDIVRYMLSNDKGIIQAPPGSGKTILSIYAVATRKKKTFILVHKDTLVEQWIGPGTPEKPQGFLTFTDIKEDQISKLTSANYKEALKKSIIVTTDQMFISLLKRDRINFLTELNKADIGIFIADEVHTSVGAPTFSECSIHVPSKVVFGLSATPYRYDGNGDIIQYHLGDIYIPHGSASIMDARVVVLLFDSGLGKSRIYINWAGRFQLARYLNLLKKSEMFMNICKSLLTKVISDGRKTIFVSFRLKMIDQLFNFVGIKDKSKFTESAKIDVLEHQIVFATPNKIRDGIDIPTKDCLIMSSPISNIEQICGRAVRISKDKKEPIVIDLVDLSYEDISRTLFKRLDYYKSITESKKEWNVRYLRVKLNGEKEELSEDQALELIKAE
jgi:superfamily II DNA or RNA helicase